MSILVFNAGSSSIRFSVYRLNPEQQLISGRLERIGESESSLSWGVEGLPEKKRSLGGVCPDHRQGMRFILELIDTEVTGASDGHNSFAAIAHRVLHGGTEFMKPTFIDERVMKVIRKYIPLARLHHPACLAGIDACRARFPWLPQVAVFDTAFHHTIPDYASSYALPQELNARYGIRKFGFHGISHQYVARRSSGFLKRNLDEMNMISLHLGNGASLTAVEKGRSVDTSMGMSPLQGLVMGSRPGDIDPALPILLAREGWSMGQYEKMIHHESGLKGLCGSNDVRDIVSRMEKGDEDAERAMKIYCYRIRKYIGAFLSVVGPVDALVFTGGVGENSAVVRKRCLEGLRWLGLEMDEEANRNGRPPCGIHSGGSRSAILVIPTNEELEMAIQTEAMLN